MLTISLSGPNRLAWVTSVVYIGTQRMVTMTIAKENWPSVNTHYLVCHMLTTTHWPCQVSMGRESYLVTKTRNGMLISSLLGLSSYYTEPFLDNKNFTLGILWKLCFYAKNQKIKIRSVLFQLGFSNYILHIASTAALPISESFAKERWSCSMVQYV